MALYPLKLAPVLKTPLWSGARLARDYGKVGALQIGESWELTVREGDCSLIENGAYRGSSLAALLSDFKEDLLGRTPLVNGRFPLLIKLIDAALPLSVQVHPDDALAALLENDSGKTELWHILAADKDAYILYGLKEGVSLEKAALALQGEDFAQVMRRIPVSPGETYFIPAGLPHAIGEGVLLAEVQQSSDLTYRLYDYGRKDKNGQARPLHIEKGVRALRAFNTDKIEALRFEKGKTAHFGGELLANTPYFYAELLSVKEELSLPSAPYMRHLLCIEGELTLWCEKEAYSVKQGESILLPASLSEILLTGEGRLLLSALPE